MPFDKPNPKRNTMSVGALSVHAMADKISMDEATRKRRRKELGPTDLSPPSSSQSTVADEPADDPSKQITLAIPKSWTPETKAKAPEMESEQKREKPTQAATTQATQSETGPSEKIQPVQKGSNVEAPGELGDDLVNVMLAGFNGDVDQPSLDLAEAMSKAVKDREDMMTEVIVKSDNDSHNDSNEMIA